MKISIGVKTHTKFQKRMLIIDVDVLEDKFAAIKNLYPHATNEKIQKAMEILKNESEKKLSM